MGGVGIFGDIQVLLDDPADVGEKRPVRPHSAAIFVRLGDVIRADCDQLAVSNLNFAVEHEQPFRLPAVLRTEASAAEHNNHRILSLQLGELPALRGVAG